MRRLLNLIILTPFLSCSHPKTDFGKILEKSAQFLDTVQSIQFDRIYTNVSVRSGDTQEVMANVYLEYFDKAKNSSKYSGLLQVCSQNYKDVAIEYRKELGRDSIKYFFYQHGKIQEKTEENTTHAFNDEHAEFLNAKSLREMIEYREENIDHFFIKDTIYNSFNCYSIVVFLKDCKDGDINEVHENIIVRKSDYMPLCLSFYGEVSNGVSMFDRYEVSNVHINQPYNEAYVNIVKRDSFLSNIDHLVVDDVFVESSLPFNQVSLKYMSDETVSLDRFKGQVVVLDFGYRGCLYCLKLIPEINRLSTKYKDVVFLGVDSRDSKEMINDFHAKNKLNYRTIDDAKQLEAKLKVTSFPTIVVIGKKGNVFYTETGYSTNGGKNLEAKIIEASEQH